MNFVPALYRAVYSHLLTVLFSARTKAVVGEIRTENARTGRRYVNADAALITFQRDMEILSSDWKDNLENLSGRVQVRRA